jgi:DNA-binding beta-propeller fold protein YncE
MKNHFLSLICGLAIASLSINASGDTIYVGNYNYQTIEQFSTNGVGSVFATGSLGYPLGIAFDSASNLYVVNSGFNSVIKITTNAVASFFAIDPGSGTVLNGPSGLAFDTASNLYVINATDGGNDFIEKFTTNGTPSTFASDPGTGLVLSEPVCMAFDHNGILYVANEAYGGTEFIEAFAPNASASTFATDPGDNSELDDPFGMAFDSSDNLYVVNNVSEGTIEKFTTNGTASTFVNTGLDYPSGAAFDSANNLYVATQANGFYNDAVLKYDTLGNATVFGTNLADSSVLAFGPGSNLFVADGIVMREFTANGDNSIFAFSSVAGADGLALDSAGNLYVANSGAENVAEFTTNAVSSTFATTAAPYGLGFDSAGNLYVANPYESIISKFTPNGNASTFASDPGSGMVLNFPEALALDSAGNVYVVSQNLTTIEKFTTNGSPSVFATNNLSDAFGPGLAFDKAGYLYAELPTGYQTYCIEKYAPNGAATLFASDPGDGSVLDVPQGMAFDSAGNLYVANYYDGTVMKFDKNGNGSVFATNLDTPESIVIKRPNTATFIPTLLITQIGTNVVLSWSTAATGYNLYSKTNLALGNWLAVSGIRGTNLTSYLMTNAITGSAKFFRLSNP